MSSHVMAALRPEMAMAQEPATVVVIDDDLSVRKALDNLFRSVGLDVELFSSPQEFLQSNRADRPGCIVLDVRFPGRSGLDMQREIAAANTALPIIFITGYGDIPMSVRAMKAGAVEFLTKPFRDQDLLDAVGVALEKDRTRRANEVRLSELRAPGFGAGHRRAAQQADRRRARGQRDDRQDASPPGDAEDAGDGPRPARPPRRSAGSRQPADVLKLTGKTPGRTTLRFTALRRR
jgi:CheY-like chemotaxis protein